LLYYVRMNTVKKCSHCKDILPLESSFFKNRHNKDGYSYDCKSCHSDRHCKIIKKLRVENPSFIHSRERRYRKKSPYKFWASRTISGHKKRGFVVNLNIRQLEEIAKSIHQCPICDVTLSWGGNSKTSKNSPTLDRTDNGNVLSQNNVQVICHKCNVTKSDRTMKEFVDYCRLVSSRFI
jgi:hypothetical protein